MITELRKYGNRGEDVATEYLQKKGYKLLARNWTASHHEVDIVMQDGDWLVMVEVKTRRSDRFADPIRAIDDEKLWNLMEAAKVYKQEHSEARHLLVRIDSVCIVGENCEQIEHLVDPFRRRIQNKTPWRSHYRKQKAGHFGFYIPGKK